MPSLLKFGLRGYVYRNTFIAVIKRISPQNVLREKYVLGTIPHNEKIISPSIVLGEEFNIDSLV